MAIEVAGLTKRFGSVVALDSFDLTVGPGEVHGLIGPNGAGKSTLLRILFGLVRPDAGDFSLFGRRHCDDGTPETLLEVAGFVDRPQFYPHLSARRNLLLLADLDGGARSCVDDVLEVTGLRGAAGRKVGGWSTGMIQRLGIAAALLRRPKLLLLDEPTEGLDPRGSRQLDGLIRALAGDGVTILLSSHDMAEVDEICDRATIIDRGRAVLSGTLADLRRAAPAGRHRLRTTDDSAALAMSGGYGVTLDAHPDRGLILRGGAAEIHSYICALGRAGISVVEMTLEVGPLTSLFYNLTGGGTGDQEVA